MRRYLAAAFVLALIQPAAAENFASWPPSSGGGAASVSNSDGTLTISPTTGSVVASLALGHANTWSATQTFADGGAWSSTGISATAIAGSGIVKTTSAGSASAPSLVVGNSTTGLYSVSTTGFGMAVAGVDRGDYGVTAGGVWTFGGGVSVSGNISATAGISTGGNITAGSGFALAFTGKGVLTSTSVGNIQFGNSDSSSPVGQVITAQSVVAGNGNTAGATFTIGGSKSNGSGGGDLILQTTLSTAASGTQNALANALILKGGTQQVQMATTGSTQVYTVSTLPTPPAAGAFAAVSDAVACTFLATLTGGGSAYCPVSYNGSAWVGG